MEEPNQSEKPLVPPPEDDRTVELYRLERAEQKIEELLAQIAVLVNDKQQDAARREREKRQTNKQGGLITIATGVSIYLLNRLLNWITGNYHH